MPITTLPAAPSTSDPTTFASKADAFIAALPAFVTETNALAADVTSKQSTASTAATSATASASAASTSETNALASKNAALASEVAAAASYDSFDDRYLGAKASDPTLDNDGNALLTGAIYWNSVSAEMRAWSGSAWLVAYMPSAGKASSGANSDITSLAALTAPTISTNPIRASDLQAQTVTTFTTAGTSTAYTLTPVPALAALTTGHRFNVTFNLTAGAAPTLAISGLTAKLLKVYDATGAKVAASATTIVANVNSDVIYDGTDYVVLNPVVVVSSGFRNKIIGGDFTINPWQRGTSFPAIASATVTYAADRFHYFQSAAGAVVSVLKTADAPTAAQAGIFTQHCLHVDVTTTDVSIAATELHQVVQPLEGLNAAAFGFGQAGTRYVTLSFWHKHTKTGVHCVSVRNSASDRSYVAEYIQDVTNTWEKAEITIPADTSGTWLYDTGVGLRLAFALSAGSNFQTTTNTWAAGNFIATANQVNNLDSITNDFKIALVQLEAGSTATPFETRSVGQELALCQRYFEKSYSIATALGAITVAGRHQTTATTVYILACGSVKFAASKRAEPTIVFYSPENGVVGSSGEYNAGGTFVANRVISVVGAGTSSFESQGLGTMTVGNNIGYHWTASAEL